MIMNINSHAFKTGLHHKSPCTIAQALTSSFHHFQFFLVRELFFQLSHHIIEFIHATLCDVTL